MKKFIGILYFPLQKIKIIWIIPYVERDIYEYEEEYDEFSKVTENDFVPALMLLTLDENDGANDVKLLAPDRDFQDIHEAVSLAKEYILD